MAITSVSCCIGSANSSEGPMSVSGEHRKRVFGENVPRDSPATTSEELCRPQAYNWGEFP